MSLKQRKINSWSQSVSSLEDKPRMSAAELKSAFDANTNQLKCAINEIIDELTEINGAENIGINTITGINAENVQHVLQYLSEQISKIDPYLGNPVAISQGGTGAKTSQEAIYTLGLMPNENLLDNPYFIGCGSQKNWSIAYKSAWLVILQKY